MRSERVPCVYIMASAFNATLYTGVTSDLMARIAQHRSSAFAGFTSRYGVKRLVYFESAATMEAAIGREKQIKRRRRDWKRNLIERQNPMWNDLAVGFGFPPLPSGGLAGVDPGTSPG